MREAGETDTRHSWRSGRTGLQHKRQCRGTSPPMVPPLRRGDGRNMLRPYGLTRTYPSQPSRRGEGNCAPSMELSPVSDARRLSRTAGSRFNR